MRRFLSCVLITFVFCFKSYSQGEGNFWYFGSYAGINFNSGTAVAITDGALLTSEGCATISDPSGNLLFYTDGITVWNKLHLMMPNGFGLMGNSSSTQSGIIVPKPGSLNKYYIFSTAAEGGVDGLRYSEVDMSLDGGLGNVTSTKNVLLFTPVAEKVTAIKSANGIDYWVIARNINSTDFLSYSITSSGVNSSPVVSPAGTLDIMYGLGYLKASSDGSKLVSLNWMAGVVDVLNFNNSTGVITTDFSFTAPFTYPYGGEFSPDGTRLYIASSENTSIYQYNMSAGTSNDIIASGIVIGTSSIPNYLGALQNAPDGKLYIAKYSYPELACIPNPNTLGVGCGFIDVALDLGGATSSFGLPNFIQTFLMAPEPVPIMYSNTCLGDSTLLFIEDSLSIDSVRWSLGEPSSGVYNTSNEYSVVHQYSTTGAYNVFAITYTGTFSDTVSTIVNITKAPEVFLGNDTILCEGDTLLLNAGTTPCVWQDFSTNQIYSVTVADTFFVSVSNMCGVASDTIICKFKPLPVISVNNPIICVGETAHLTANGASNYSWSAGVVVTGTNTADVNPTSNATYTVSGIGDGCIATSISTVIVNQLPVPTFTVSSNNTCLPECIQFNKTGSAVYIIQGYSFGNGDSAFTPSASYCYTVPGVYPVNFFCTDINGCNGNTSLVAPITILAPITADFSMVPNELPKINTEVSFVNLSSNGIIASWNFDDPTSGSLNTSTSFSPTHSYAAEGVYCVALVVTNSIGCWDSISRCIEVVDEIVIPNIFSPNGDNKNDVFYIDNLKLGKASVKIFNRWGNVVYTSDAYMNDWNGSGISDGVYYYLINYSVDNKIYSGYVHVIASE